ncbi:MAG: RNA-guided pseudouridylation complex pseudouridine synthase subunit Cbf5, partial [Candidatus Altiarchaeales archaeon]|nr:RNA-guided pseudouridylation complex pseudouridine synthase subunit Cbf5 [Candidatus Altiarchaeales archaeon]
CIPEERPIGEYIKNGLVILDKPRGPTSHQTASWVKEILGVQKAGHSGTLDPAVSGVLPIAVEDASKILDFLLGEDKEYITVMRLHADVKKEKLEKTLKQFQGKIYQKPPLKSAVKRQLRTRTIHKIEILEINERDILLKIKCEAGTYIRKLLHDIGLVLGVGAHMQELRRTKAGPFNENQVVTLHDLKDAWQTLKEEKDDTQLRKTILPIEQAVQNHRKIWVKDTAVDAICHGANLHMPGIARLHANIKKGQETALMTLKNELIAIATSNHNSQELLKKEHGVAAELQRVIMKPGTYPKQWKTKPKNEDTTN